MRIQARKRVLFRKVSRWKRAFQVMSMVLGTVLLMLLCWEVWIFYATMDRISSSAQLLKPVETALVLGTSRYLKDGNPNPFLHHRLDMAHTLYRSGKVKRFILSGDNRELYYNEPRDMRDELLKRGIPDSVITLDYGGTRTHDSILRAHLVFGKQEIVIISQSFHVVRAVFIALHHGMNAYGIVADSPQSKATLKMQLRERFARIKMFIDLYVQQPHTDVENVPSTFVPAAS